MGQGLKPCPRCMRQMDASREVCVYCAQMGEITLPSPPVRTAAASGSPLIPILIGVVVLLVAAVGVLFVMVLQKPSTAPGAQVVKAAPASTLKPAAAPAAQPALAPPAVAPPAAATNYTPAPPPSAPAGRYTPPPAQFQPVATQPAAERAPVSPAKPIDWSMLDRIEADYQATETAVSRVGSGVSATDAEFKVGDFLSRSEGALTAETAYLERNHLSRFDAPPALQHLVSAIENYRDAANNLKNYLVFAQDHWLIEAASYHSKAKAEAQAVRTTSP